MAAGGVERFEASLDRLDEKLNAVWTDLGRLRAEWRAAVEEVTPLLDEILVEVRAVGEAAASVHAEVRSVKDRVEALDALRGPPSDPVPFELPPRALAQEDAQALLRRLAGEGVPQRVLATVADRLGGHPLALTWAGSQLGLGEEPPEHFAEALATAGLPRVAEPGYEAHTLVWLYRRSVDHLTPDARCVLAGAGRGAAVPFPLGLAVAGLGAAGDTVIEARAADALKLLVRHGLLRWLRPLEGYWEFTHVLAHQFARAAALADRTSLARFGGWAIRYVDERFRGSQLGGDCTALERALRHAVALVGLKESEGALGDLMETLRYEVADRLFAFGRVDLAKAPLMAVRDRLSDTEPFDVASQRELSVSNNRIGDVQVAQGQLGEALASYRAGLEIARSLAQADPANAAWQRDLSLCLTRIAEALARDGRRAEALPYAEESLAIDEWLAALDPSNATWQRDVAASRALVARLTA